MSFINIFSTKKVPDKKINILADNRERNALVVSELVSKGFEVEFKQLPVGDYIVNDVAIERKTISDLKHSIINKRILRQLTEIKQFKKYILVIEGFEKESYNEGIVHANALRGFLLSVALNHKVPIIYSVDSKDTAEYISILAKKSPNKNFALRANKQILSEKDRLTYILEGFPGIGPSTAKLLLTKFKTLKEIVNAPESELEQLIGKKSEQIIKLINLNYRNS